MPAPHRLDRKHTALLVIDIQERLAAAMPAPQLDRMLGRVEAAIEGARVLGLPIVVTEQYPKGLGPTVARIRGRLGENAAAIEKLDFSAAVPSVLSALQGRTQILITGMEAHVCVFQSARDLVTRGHEAFVCGDAVISRADEDRRIGLELAREAGCTITTCETALFDLLGCAGTPEFKRISQAVR
jgi:nicotinamidase-related amidase